MCKVQSKVNKAYTSGTYIPSQVYIKTITGFAKYFIILGAVNRIIYNPGIGVLKIFLRNHFIITSFDIVDI